MGGKGSGNRMAAQNNKPWEKSPITNPQIDATPGMFATMTRQALEVGFMWDKIDIKSPAELGERALKYFNYCIQNDTKPGNMGLYSAWGMDKGTVHSILVREPSSARTYTIKKSIQIIADIREKLMLEGKVNPITGIFWQKNFDGFSDQQELIVAPKQTIAAEKSLEELEQAIDADIPNE